MTNYRNSMQIVSDLLTVTKDSGEEGIKTTRLLSKANLSHSILSKFLDNLTVSGLINIIEYDGSVIKRCSNEHDNLSKGGLCWSSDFYAARNCSLHLSFQAVILAFIDHRRQ